MTFSMLGFCRRTGDIGLAAATCSAATGARLGQRAIAGGREWIIVSQAHARPALGFEAADALAAGTGFDSLETRLAGNDVNFEHRQLGILEKNGSSFAYDGPSADDWKGHAVAEDGLAIGNYLAGRGVVDAMARDFTASSDRPLAERLIGALEAGRDAGGQIDAQGRAEPELSAFIRIFNSAADPYIYGPDGRCPVLDLRVDLSRSAIVALSGMYEDMKPLRAAYELRARDPKRYFDQPIGRWDRELFERLPA